MWRDKKPLARKHRENRVRNGSKSETIEGKTNHDAPMGEINVADMTPHARKRASERRISNILIKDIIRKGRQWKQNDGRIKFRYRSHCVIGAYHNNWLRVITCY